MRGEKLREREKGREREKKGREREKDVCTITFRIELERIVRHLRSGDEP